MEIGNVVQVGSESASALAEVLTTYDYKSNGRVVEMAMVEILHDSPSGYVKGSTANYPVESLTLVSLQRLGDLPDTPYINSSLRFATLMQIGLLASAAHLANAVKHNGWHMPTWMMLFMPLDGALSRIAEETGIHQNDHPTLEESIIETVQKTTELTLELLKEGVGMLAALKYSAHLQEVIRSVWDLDQDVNLVEFLETMKTDFLMGKQAYEQLRQLSVLVWTIVDKYDDDTLDNMGELLRPYHPDERIR